MEGTSADYARLHMIWRPKSPRRTCQRCAAKFCCCSRSSRRAQSPSESSCVCAWRSWLSRCKHGRTSCPPLSRPWGTTSKATPASWISYACSQRRSRKAEKSPCLYVERYVATRLYHFGSSVARLGQRSLSNPVMIGRRSRPEDIGASGGQCPAGRTTAHQLCAVIA